MAKLKEHDFLHMKSVKLGYLPKELILVFSLIKQRSVNEQTLLHSVK